LDPKDFFGKPLLEGTADAQPIRVPMKDEFAPFVMIREAAR
jgi:hypothetical protein